MSVGVRAAKKNVMHKTVLLKIVERKADLRTTDREGSAYDERVYKALWYDDTEPYWAPLAVFQVPRVSEENIDPERRRRQRPTLVMEVGKLYSVRVLERHYMCIGGERRLNALVVDVATEVQKW